MTTDPIRTDPPPAAPETEMLLAWLDYHRATLRMKCFGLSAAQLAQTHPPSSMTLGGMLKHLAYVEQSWTREVFLGLDALEPWTSVDWRADHDWDCHSAADDTPEELLALHAHEAVAADVVIRTAGSLDDPAARVHHDQTFTLRWILVHLVEEYARHVGHADLIRESIDGLTGE